MAIIDPAKVSQDLGKSLNVETWKWAGVTDADTITPLNCSDAREITVQVAGTIGGPAATVTFTGSLELDKAEASRSYTTLTRADGSTALSFTALDIAEVLEIPSLLKPTVTGGTGESVDIYARLVR